MGRVQDVPAPRRRAVAGRIAKRRPRLGSARIRYLNLMRHWQGDVQEVAKRRGGCKPGEAIEGFSMFLPHRFSSSYGSVLCNEPRTLAIPSTPAAALAFASMIDRQADACLAEGRCTQAERLAHLALEARCRALGGRA